MWDEAVMMHNLEHRDKALHNFLGFVICSVGNLWFSEENSAKPFQYQTLSYTRWQMHVSIMLIFGFVYGKIIFTALNLIGHFEGRKVSETEGWDGGGDW